VPTPIKEGPKEKNIQLTLIRYGSISLDPI
jgi:hypothetical protein